MASETILVVEDEPSRPSASSNPDLILMDIRIKGAIDGIETATQIRKTSDVPGVPEAADRRLAGVA